MKKITALLFVFVFISSLSISKISSANEREFHLRFLFPEGTVYSQTTDCFLVAYLVGGGVIGQVDRRTGIETIFFQNDFSKPPFRPVLLSGGAISSSQKKYLVCGSFFDPTNPSVIPQAYVFEFDLSTPNNPPRIHDLGLGTFCNDTVVASDDTVYATDHIMGRVYKIDPAGNVSIELADQRLAALYLVNRNFTPGEPAVGPFPGANGVVLTPNQDYLLINASAPHGLYAYNLATRKLLEVGLPEQEEGLRGNGNPLVYAGPDGMTFKNANQLLIAQSGAITEVNFEGSYTKVSKIRKLPTELGLADVFVANTPAGQQTCQLFGHVVDLLFGNIGNPPNPPGRFKLVCNN